jgi:hypothetical protein
MPAATTATIAVATAADATTIAAGATTAGATTIAVGAGTIAATTTTAVAVAGGTVNANGVRTTKGRVAAARRLPCPARKNTTTPTGLHTPARWGLRRGVGDLRSTVEIGDKPNGRTG